MAVTDEKKCDRTNEECIENIDDIECKAAVNNPRAHLVPRPSEDEGDPLNWPMRLKTLILFQVCWLAFLGTWNTAAINSAYSLLAEDLGVSEVQASYQTTIVITLNGVGPFIWIPLANVYGRRFVYLITTFIGFATALGCGFVHSFGALVGIRAINGIFPVSMALGPVTVTDLFFYHQRGRALGLFTVMLTSGSHFLGLFGGPVAKFLGWRWIFWITAAMNFVTLVTLVFGLPETMYYKPRLYSDTNTEPPKLSMAKYREVLRPWTSFPGVELQAKHFFIPAFRMALYPSVLFPSLYYASQYCFTAIFPAVTYAIIFKERFGWSALQCGLAYGGTMTIGSIVGEFAAGKTIDDIVHRHSIRLGVDSPPPEVRFKGIWTGVALIPAGLLIFGFTIQYNSHWSGPLAGFGGIPVLGGTWLENQQIHSYMHGVADKYDCNKFIKYRHSIKAAAWNEDKAKWEIQVENGDGVIFQDDVDVFINAGGVLNNWKWPNIEGIHNFKGKLIHSARWDQEYNFTGKKVASIGIGSSGIQIVPQLAKFVDSMDVYVRTQTWISPAPGINEPTANDPDMDADYNFTPESMAVFKDPEVLRQYRAAIMDRRIENFQRALADSDVQKRARELFRKSMTEKLGDSEKGREAAQYLLPDFPVGCRRQTPGPGFLEALTQDNVDMWWDVIARITEKGILTRSGEEKDYDVIVCATGFDTSFKPSFPLIGRNKVNLASKWEVEQPKAYFGFMVPDMPNYFCFIGPNSPISNGSLVLGIQATALYVYKWLEKLQTEMISSFEVRNDVNEEYNQHIQQYLQRTVWTRGCRSWYKRGTVDGPVVAIYGGTSFHFMEAIKNPRWEDFNIQRTAEASLNRFAYLGNGFSQRETKGQSVGATQTLDFDEYWRLFVLPDIHN